MMAIQSEVAQLASEIDRSAGAAQFNGTRLFDPSQASAVGDETQLAVFDGLTSVGSWLENSELLIQNLYGIKSDGAALQIKYTGFSDTAGGVAAYVQVAGFDAQGRENNLLLQVDLADFVPPNLPNGGSAPLYNDRIMVHEMVHAVMGRTTSMAGLSTWFLEGAAEFIHGADERVEGSVAGGAVTVTVSGIGELVAVAIRPGTFDGDSAEDLADLADLLVAAFRDAKSRSDELASQTLGPLAGGGLPGLG